jgi:outer membrane autotransporter protein
VIHLLKHEEFLTGNTVKTDDDPFSNNLDGTTGRFGAGIATRLSTSLYLYGEYDYATGNHIQEPWAIDAGLRWEW